MSRLRVAAAVVGFGLLVGVAAPRAMAMGLGGGARPAEVNSSRFQVTVEAGKHDRGNTPVRVLLSMPASMASARTCDVTGPTGRQVQAQLTGPRLLAAREKAGAGRALRELHFILADLEAGRRATFRASVSRSSPQPDPEKSFRWHDTEGRYAELRLGSRPVLRCMYQALDDSDPKRRERTYKVFHHVFDPTGSRTVTKGAGGRYTHHRGLFYGFNRTSYGEGKRVDIWHCKGDTHQLHVRFVSTEEGPVVGRHRLEINWNGVGKETFAVEHRELTVYDVPGGNLIEFASRVTGRYPKITFDGDPQHAGFHFRAADEVASKTKQETFYIRVDGIDQPGKTRNWPGQKDHVNLPWNAMSFVLGGQRYTTAYLDRPENPKEARFSERDYGRFGSYFKYELDQGKTLDVNYRIWHQKEAMTIEGVAAKSANFTEPPKVSVR